MTMTDPIADMLSRLRNAAAVGKTSVELPSSKLKVAVAEVLKKTGYLATVKAADGVLTLEIASDGGQIKLSGIKRISKPGRRYYVGADELPQVRRGLGVAVVSTSAGVMTAKDARKQGLGGEVLLEVF
jgi:small subunit ribosomal protein S8